MAEYIDRDLTIQYLCEACSNFEGNICTLSEECEDIRIIRAMSAENVQPVRRGKWVYYKNNGIWDIHKCTVCNTPFELPMDVVASSVFCYCPHCGADMRGEENG